MINSQNSNPFIYFVKQSIKILGIDAPIKLVKLITNHLRCKPLQSHWVVLGYKYRADILPLICEAELEIREITASDEDEIDELTAMDEWKVPKAITLNKLRHKRYQVYIAKYKGRIVASQTVITRNRFQDPLLMREFDMASNEAFYFRAFVIPEFQGRGIYPILGRYYMRDVAVRYGRVNGLTLVSPNNRSSLRSLAKIGWSRIGRAGFIEIFGIRFHYLWGSEAFKETRRRFFKQNIVGVHPVFQGVILKSTLTRGSSSGANRSQQSLLMWWHKHVRSLKSRSISIRDP
jgi:GNAT superfamily N-acetyltransferase